MTIQAGTQTGTSPPSGTHRSPRASECKLDCTPDFAKLIRLPEFASRNRTHRLTRRRLQASRAASTLVTAYVLNGAEAAAFDWSRFCLRFLAAARAASLAGRTERNDYGLFIEMHLVQMRWQALFRQSEPNSGSVVAARNVSLGHRLSVFLRISVVGAHPGRLA